MVVNGENHEHRRTMSDQGRRKQSPSVMNWFKQGSSWGLSRGSEVFQADCLLTMPEKPQTLYISGKQKNMSPSRSSGRKNRLTYFGDEQN